MLQKLDQVLQEKEIKPTAMRLLVLDFLLSQQTALSLNDLEVAFRRSDRVTLYRTLKTFERKGLVHSIEDGTGSVKYALCAESCSSEEHHDLHVHFHCNRCAATYCLPKSTVPQIPLPDNFLAEEVSMVVKGACGNCSADNAIHLQGKCSIRS